MLQAITKPLQHGDENHRQWYINEEVELIVFTDKDNKLRQFQLAYDKLNQEHLLIWDIEHGFSHGCVDDGQAVSGRARAPVMVSCQFNKITDALQQFQNHSHGLDREIREFIVDKLSELTL